MGARFEQGLERMGSPRQDPFLHAVNVLADTYAGVDLGIANWRMPDLV